MQEERPLVSIIVPIYNAKNHIGRCLESIRRQTYENIEILLINDGSQDVSGPVCRMYAQVDPRIVLAEKDNSGVSATRNLGLRMAKGQYLQFVDSDDYLEPNATELLVDRALKSRADLVIAHYYRITPPEKENQTETLATYGFLREGPLDKTEFARGLMAEPATFYYGVMWNKLYRSDLVREHGLQCSEELEWSEDFLFNLSYIRYAERFYALATPVYNYVLNPNSICSTKINPFNVLAVKAGLYSYYKELYESLGLYEENRRQIWKYMVSAAEG